MKHITKLLWQLQPLDYFRAQVLADELLHLAIERNESKGLELLLNPQCMSLICNEERSPKKIPFSNMIKRIFVFKEASPRVQ
jgi:hypothetical protein